jgi:hypothetical protein
MMFQRQLDFLSKLKHNKGFIGVTLRELEMTRGEFNEWIGDDLFFEKKVLEIQELSIDYVEEKLLEEIQGGNLQAIQFFLKTKGKERGY